MRRLILGSVVLLLLVFSLTSTTLVQSSPMSTTRVFKTAVQQGDQGTLGDTIVYVTKTGAKCHRAGCRSLSKSAIPKKLQDAVAEATSRARSANRRCLALLCHRRRGGLR
jgi:hypothetical protein